MVKKVKSNLQENFIDLTSLDSALARSVQERAFGKGIALAAGFDLGAAIPLDARVIAQTTAERDAHVENNRAYEGMQVYVIDEKTNYQLVDGEWVETGVSKTQLAEINAAIESVRTDLTAALEAEKLRINTAESDIDSLESRMGAVETEQTNLDSRLDTAEADIVAIKGNVSSIESDILEVKASVSQNTSNISGVTERVTAAEGKITALEEAKLVSDGKISTLESGLAAEIERATAEEKRIEGLVTAETGRATAQEAAIREEFAAADLALKGEITREISAVSDKLAADKLELQGNIDTLEGTLTESIEEVAEGLAKEILDRTAADSAQDLIIAQKADKTYVDQELAKKSDDGHKHVAADITDLGTVAKLNVGTEAGQVPVLDEHGKLDVKVVPSVAINETNVVEDIDSALALNQKAGDIIIINPNSAQVQAITAKYYADQQNAAQGFQNLGANVLNDEFAAYLAEGKTTYICVDPLAESFEERYRPLNSIADTMTRGEIEKELAKKDTIESVDGKIVEAKGYADTQIGLAKEEINGTITSTKETLEQAIEAVDAKADANAGEITAIKQAATELKSTVDTHVADNVKHITAEERQAWNAKTDKKTFLIGDDSAVEFELSHNLQSEDVVVSVRDAASKEIVFTDITVKDENTVVVSFAKAPSLNEFKVVVIG